MMRTTHSIVAFLSRLDAVSLHRNQMCEADSYTTDCLSVDHLSWMAQLSESLWIQDDVLLLHGTPNSDVSYFSRNG
jgi:hypothetical protein